MDLYPGISWHAKAEAIVVRFLVNALAKKSCWMAYGDDVP
jgi:hypothetical protein